MFTFYIGIHIPSWIPEINFPIMVSVRRLRGRKKFYKPSHLWALDSGGFTELSTYGKWETSADKYVEEVHTLSEHMGIPSFVSPQDWMCEPFILNKTGLAVQEHQRRTIENFLYLRSKISPGIYVLPVLQGFTLEEYLRCIEMYEDYGIRLKEYPLVGLGSICRRQKTKEGIFIIEKLTEEGLKLHGFGLKSTALKVVSKNIVSSDSMAWSYAGRRIKTGLQRPKNYANSFEFMVRWRKELLECL